MTLTVRWQPGWKDAMRRVVRDHLEKAGQAAVASARKDLAARTSHPAHANVIDHHLTGNSLHIGYRSLHPGWYLAFQESGTTTLPPNPIIPDAIRAALRTPHH